MKEKTIDPRGYANFAKSYADSAEHLIASIKSKELTLSFNAPIDFLVAHAVELNLKALVLKYGITECEMRSYGHNIAELYLVAKKTDGAAQIVKAAENEVRDYWRATLRNARDVHREKIEAFTGSLNQEQQNKFGIYDNNSIGRELPELGPIIQWYSALHLNDGSDFKYLKVGMQSRIAIRQFGLEEDVQTSTALQACRTFHCSFKKSS